MEIKWPNVIVFGLVVLTVVLIVKMPRPVLTALAAARQIGPGSTSEERILGLVTVGLICVTIVAVVKIVVQGTGSDS